MTQGRLNIQSGFDHNEVISIIRAKFFNRLIKRYFIYMFAFNGESNIT
jgi:hypothetical protein